MGDQALVDDEEVATPVASPATPQDDAAASSGAAPSTPPTSLSLWTMLSVISSNGSEAVLQEWRSDNLVIYYYVTVNTALVRAREDGQVGWGHQLPQQERAQQH